MSFFFSFDKCGSIYYCGRGWFLKNLEKPMETQSVTRKKEATAD